MLKRARIGYCSGAKQPYTVRPGKIGHLSTVWPARCQNAREIAGVARKLWAKAGYRVGIWRPRLAWFNDEARAARVWRPAS